MSIEKVRKYFAGFGMEDRILEFSVSSATVELPPPKILRLVIPISAPGPM